MKRIYFGLFVSVFLSAIIFSCLFCGGCDQQTITELDTQITDPNGSLQVAAEAVGESLVPLQVLVKTLPIPHATTISAILAAVGWALTIIKSLQKKKSDDLLKESDISMREIIVGIENAKKKSDEKSGKRSPIERDDLRYELNNTESVVTRAKVAAIRREMSSFLDLI